MHDKSYILIHISSLILILKCKANSITNISAAFKKLKYKLVKHYMSKDH